MYPLSRLEISPHLRTAILGKLNSVECPSSWPRLSLDTMQPHADLQYVPVDFPTSEANLACPRCYAPMPRWDDEWIQQSAGPAMCRARLHNFQ